MGEELVRDPGLAQVARQLRGVVGVPDRTGNLLKRHPGDRPVVILIRVGKGALDHAPARTVASVEHQADVVDLLQPLLRLHYRVQRADPTIERPSPLQVAGMVRKQQLTREGPAVAVPVDRLAAGGGL